MSKCVSHNMQKCDKRKYELCVILFVKLLSTNKVNQHYSTFMPNEEIFSTLFLMFLLLFPNHVLNMISKNKALNSRSKELRSESLGI